MTEKRRIMPVTIENARIIFRNFAGRKGPFNEEGERSFTIVLPENVGKEMLLDGWTTVKEKPPYGGDEGAPNEYHLPVAVEYRKGRPPRCVMISSLSKTRTELGADEVALIDFAQLDTVDVTVTPYQWEVNGNSGVKAYLKTIFVTIVEDELDFKYAQLPDAHPATDPLTHSDPDEI